MLKFLMAASVLALSSCAPAHMATTTVRAQVAPVADLSSRVPIVMQSGVYWTEAVTEPHTEPDFITGEYYFEIESDDGPTVMRPVYVKPE